VFSFLLQVLRLQSWASRIPDIKEKLQLSEAGLGSVLLALPLGLMASLFSHRVVSIAFWK
jgi:hypothetical protein